MAAPVINIANLHYLMGGGMASFSEFDDIVYGVYVRERDIMEIPASGRLFMGHRRVARRHAVETSVSFC